MRLILLLALVMAIAQHVSALEGFLMTWLQFVDTWGIMFLWQNILYYTFTIGLPYLACDLYDLAGQLNSVGGLVDQDVYDAAYDADAAKEVCREGFQTYYDAIWYTDESPIQTDWDYYNYTY